MVCEDRVEELVGELLLRFVQFSTGTYYCIERNGLNWK